MGWHHGTPPQVHRPRSPRSDVGRREGASLQLAVSVWAVLYQCWHRTRHQKGGLLGKTIILHS